MASDRNSDRLGTESREHDVSSTYDIAEGNLAPDVNVGKALRKLHNFFNANFISEEPKLHGRWRKIGITGNWQHLLDHAMAINSQGFSKSSLEELRELQKVLENNLVNVAARALCILELFEESKEEK